MTEYIDYHFNPYYDRQHKRKSIEKAETLINDLSKGDLNGNLPSRENKIATLLKSFPKR